MKRWFLSISFILPILIGCGGGTPRGEGATGPGKRLIKRPGLNSPEFIEFKKSFAEKFPDFDSLLPEVLFLVIDAIPSQSTTWGCGLVQSNMAKVAAKIALGISVEHLDRVKCNEVGSYPLLANIKVVEVLKPIVKKRGLNLELEGGQQYFRVGASPKGLVRYLNEELPKGMVAKYHGEERLDKVDLFFRIEANLKTAMPLILLTVIDAEKLLLHYVSIVGVKKDKSELLILDTKGEGTNRLKAMDLESFLSSMNTQHFRQSLRNRTVQIQQGVGLWIYDNILEGRKPTKEDLNDFANYNWITFTKR